MCHKNISFVPISLVESVCLSTVFFFLKKNRFLVQQSSSQKATSQNLAYLGALCSVLEKIGETKQVEDERRSGRQRKKEMDGCSRWKEKRIVDKPTTKSKEVVCNQSFLCCNYTTGMPVYFPFSGATFVRTMHLWTEQLSM